MLFIVRGAFHLSLEYIYECASEGRLCIEIIVSLTLCHWCALIWTRTAFEFSLLPSSLLLSTLFLSPSNFTGWNTERTNIALPALFQQTNIEIVASTTRTYTSSYTTQYHKLYRRQSLTFQLFCNHHHHPHRSCIEQIHQQCLIESRFNCLICLHVEFSTMQIRDVSSTNTSEMGQYFFWKCKCEIHESSIKNINFT